MPHQLTPIKPSQAPEGGCEADPSGRAAEEFKEAVTLHYRGVEGDKQAVARAVALLEPLHAAHPEDCLILAYLGSAVSLQGRDARSSSARFDKALKGLKMLDRAVAGEPENTEIRLLRGNVCRRLPEKYFHRTATAVEDFQYLIGRYEQDPNAFEPGLYRRLLQDLAIAFEVLDRSEQVKAVRGKLKKKRARKGSDLETEAAMELAEAKQLYGRALAGDRPAAGMALEIFTRVMQEDPENPMLLAALADCHSLLGRSAEEPSEMFAEALTAMKYFDDALKLDPENIRLRLMRAAQSLRLPEAFFKRTATAIGDLEYIVSRYDNDPTVLPKDLYHRVLYHLGCAHRRLGREEEAAEAWAKLASLDPAPAISRRIQSPAAERPPGWLDRLSLERRAEYYAEAERLHDLGVAGDRAAAAAALTLWQRAHEADRDDPVAEACLGSCQALTGRDAVDSKEIFNNTISGLIHLNKAAERDGGNLKVRALRGFVAHALPENFFHLTERAIEDLRFVRSAYESNRDAVPRHVYLEACRCLAEAYHRAGKAEEAAEIEAELAGIIPGPAERRAAQEEVQLYPYPGFEEDGG